MEKTKEKFKEILLSLTPTEALVLTASLKSRLNITQDNIIILKECLEQVNNGTVKLKVPVNWGKLRILPGETDVLTNLLNMQIKDAENEEKHLLSIIEKFKPFTELFSELSVEDTDLNNSYETTGLIYDSLSFS